MNRWEQQQRNALAEEYLDAIGYHQRAKADALEKFLKLAGSYQQQYKQQCAEYDEQFDRSTKSIASLLKRCQKFVKENFEPKEKTYRFKNGKIRISRLPDKIVFKDEDEPIEGSSQKLIDFVKRHEEFKDFLKIHESVDWEGLRAFLCNEKGKVFSLRTGKEIKELTMTAGFNVEIMPSKRKYFAKKPAD